MSRPGHALVEFEGVHKYFGETHVLKDIDLAVEEQEVTVIIGPSGSGKSTLLRCVNRLEEIQRGEIRLGGESISAPDANVDRLRQRDENAVVAVRGAWYCTVGDLTSAATLSAPAKVAWMSA
jgi:polar amino acid transport system ATP-binding protein